MKILASLLAHPRMVIKAILGLAVAFLLSWGITLHRQNKTLSESLEMALNNIEAYLGSLEGSLLANNVLLLTVDELLNYNDKLVRQLDSISKENKIKPKQIHSAATQTLSILVNESKGVGGDLILILNDTIYKDSINYNDLTTVYYTISKDTVNIGLNIKNTQYLFIYSSKEYKNKKNWFKRLITFDWKKVTKNKYIIENTNNLIHTDSVRVIEIQL